MSEPFIGQIIMFAGNFAPRDWAFCDGQLIAIGDNQALFAILGTTYGGDGRTNFALPDLRGRVVIHEGGGPGLSNYQLGEKGGVEQVTLTTIQIPSHTHTLRASTEGADTEEANSATVLGRGDESIYYQGNANTDMSAASLTNTGAGQSHTNVQPYGVVNYIIALQGVFPSRS